MQNRIAEKYSDNNTSLLKSSFIKKRTSDDNQNNHFHSEIPLFFPL